MDGSAGDIFGREVCVTEEEVLLGNLGIPFRGDVLRTRFQQVVYYEDVSWRWKRFRAHELFPHSGRRFGASRDGSNRVPNRPVLKILNSSRSWATVPVRKTSFMLVCSHFCTPVLTVVSVSGRSCD